MIAKIFQGGLVGLVATAPMSAAMLLMHRRLPWHERQPLPPRQITTQAARKANVEQHLDDRSERKAATLTAHYSFGTAMGSLYGLVCSQGVRPGVSTGVLYGLCVWAGNYLAALPALGLHAPATNHPPRRTLLMVVAHLAWGAVVGLLMLGLDSDKEAKR